MKNEITDHTSNELDRGSDFEHDAGGVDAGDMYRMGKEQQFKVRNILIMIAVTPLTSVV